MKSCRICKIPKEPSEFYRDKRSSDGLTGDCKDCRKERSRERERFLRDSDPDFAENERIRARDKYKRLYVGKIRNPKATKRASKAYAEKYPEKKEAHRILAQAKKSKRITIDEGFEAHHFSYNLKDALRFFVLSKTQHRRIHQFLKYDDELFLFRTDNGILLDSIEEHRSYIVGILGQNVTKIEIELGQ